MNILRSWTNTDNRAPGRRLLALLFILALAFAVRGLTMRFLRDHLSDPGWFQSGTYAIFDKQAQRILDGGPSVLWISDPAEVESAIYPPGYPLWLASLYAISGQRSAMTAQRVQWVLDSLSVLLIVGIGVTAYNWSTGLTSGFLAAASPLLALYGAGPGADAPTSWILLIGVWMLLLAFKRQRMTWAVGAGLIAGASCWVRPNGLLLVFFWALALLFLLRANRRRRMLLSAGVILGATLLLAPILVRNAIAFRAFVPTGLGMGTNLWEGIGETERAAEFGAVCSDAVILEQERTALGLPADAPFSLYYPDGVRRDRERARKALSVITAHPWWFSGVVLRRAAGQLKFAGQPLPFRGSAGINVTSRKCLPPNWQNGPLGLAVNLLGMVQSVLRYLLLPLILIGVIIAVRLDWRIFCLLLTTVFYYLVVGSVMHMEIRYGLPMQALLLVWAGLAITYFMKRAASRIKSESRWREKLRPSWGN